MTELCNTDRRMRTEPKPQRCQATAGGNQCIHDEGHDGEHFAKSLWSYFVWPQVKE